MAKAESACPSGKTGGNLGQIGPGQTVPEFEQALASLPVGEIAPAPIESRYGFHIVVLDRRIEGRALPFEMVHPRIATWLDEKVRRVAIRQYITILAGRAEITGISFDGNASPLVQ
jgi:peptidyl-prolyl cis-trans isomerase C